MSTTTHPSPASAYNQDKWASLLGGIVLDRKGGVPVYLQIQNSLRQIMGASCQSGERIPPEGHIAKALQVSRVTVRHALVDLTTAGLITRRRALGTVVAKSKKVNGLENLAIIAPDYPSFVLAAHMSALTNRAREFGARVNFITLRKGEDWSYCRKQIDFAPSDGGMAFVCNAQSTTLDLQRIASMQGYRSVCVCPFIRDYPGHQVFVSNATQIRQGLEYLRQAGHRRIVFLAAEPEELDEVKERVRCFEQISGQLGLKAARVLHCGMHTWENPAEGAAQAAASIWREKDRPTAVFALSDETAMGALLGLVRLGAQVPEDISILSYDGTALTRLAQPGFTTLATPFAEVAEKALSLLMTDPSRPQHIGVEPPPIREASSVRVLTPEEQKT